MKPLLTFLLAFGLFLPLLNFGQVSQNEPPVSDSPQQSLNSSFHKKLDKHRKKIEREFKDPKKSPLKDRARDFQGLDFFPADPAYKVLAKFTRTPDEPIFDMQTSSGKVRPYVKYGELSFKINGTPCKLNVYQNQASLSNSKYKNYLFLPFKDITTGETTYGGGRYLDCQIPDSDYIELDFNECYNPYCAYSEGWSCPIVPEENQIQVEVKAGVIGLKGVEMH